MNFQLDWPPDVVDRLTEEAGKVGLSLDAYVLQSVLQKGRRSDRVTEEERTKRLAREEAGRSIRELRKGNILGPDLSVRDLTEEGRRF